MVLLMSKLYDIPIREAQAKQCSRCTVVKEPGDFPPTKRSPDWKSYWCRDCTRDANRLVRFNNRQKVIEHYGRSCVKCGYDEDDRALQIDHINGGGRQHRKVELKGNQAKFMKYVLDHPEDFQLLCANCHAIKTEEER